MFLSFKEGNSFESTKVVGSKNRKSLLLNQKSLVEKCFTKRHLGPRQGPSEGEGWNRGILCPTNPGESTAFGCNCCDEMMALLRDL